MEGANPFGKVKNGTLEKNKTWKEIKQGN